MTGIATHACACQADVFVDSANVDGVLGVILGRRPASTDRPRWDRVKQYIRSTKKPHFVLNQRYFTDKVYSLRQALRAMGYQVDVVSEVGTFPDNDDPVDTFILIKLHEILRSLERGESRTVAVVSHDHCYAPVLTDLLRATGSVTIVGFREEMPAALLELQDLGADIVDIEHDMGAFLVRLPRPRLPQYVIAS